ncbi:hypothetical protein PLANPX_0883 [Lacipirellula parvula]|uniref:Uncharacterized protein n=1 Tax=Lacipirellula parvula TaxID=2650471 RepID=A0A5K7X935_9BACT|nr:hypothetical protein PLANPX_0883 [Lacipirellula parvula]
MPRAGVWRENGQAGSMPGQPLGQRGRQTSLENRHSIKRPGGCMGVIPREGWMRKVFVGFRRCI